MTAPVIIAWLLGVVPMPRILPRFKFGTIVYTGNVDIPMVVRRRSLGGGGWKYDVEVQRILLEPLSGIGIRVFIFTEYFRDIPEEKLRETTIGGIR